MSDHHVYKKTEVVGSSRTSIEEAINNALEECAKSLRNMEWFEVTETRGHIENGKVGLSCWLKAAGPPVTWPALRISSMKFRMARR